MVLYSFIGHSPNIDQVLAVVLPLGNIRYDKLPTLLQHAIYCPDIKIKITWLTSWKDADGGGRVWTES